MGTVVLIGANGKNLKLGSQMGENFAGVLHVRNRINLIVNLPKRHI